jgi:hypothetical protein
LRGIGRGAVWPPELRVGAVRKTKTTDTHEQTMNLQAKGMPGDAKEYTTRARATAWAGGA